jgi:hypothetical protein
VLSLFALRQKNSAAHALFPSADQARRIAANITKLEIKGELVEPKGEQSQSMPLGTNVIAARAAVTPESLLDEFEQARAQAMANGRESAAVSATKEKSILTGHRIERAEIGAPGEFENLTDNEVERLLVEHLADLGWALVPAISDRSIALNGASRTLKDRDQ